MTQAQFAAKFCPNTKANQVKGNFPRVMYKRGSQLIGVYYPNGFGFVFGDNDQLPSGKFNKFNQIKVCG